MPRLNFTSLHSRPPAPTIPTQLRTPQLNSAPQTSTQHTSTPQTSTQHTSTLQTSTCWQSHFIQPVTLDSDVSTLNSLLDFFGMPPRQQEAPHISSHWLIATTRAFILDPEFHHSTLKFSPKSQPIAVLLSPPECNITYAVPRYLYSQSVGSHQLLF